MKQFKRDESQNSTKLHLDKYYTPDEVATKCIETAYRVIGKENITEIIEPAAGNGVFSSKIEGCIAYDLEPEAEGIMQQDFMLLSLGYKQGRLFIGNPPYGSRMNLAKAFCNRAFELGDYVAFILPISQLNNSQSIYKFDLVYSEDLGKRDYSCKAIHCCFNIYKRPENGLNKILNFSNSEIIEIIEIRESIKSKNPKREHLVRNYSYDIAICAWGNAIGKEIECEGQYVTEFYIKVKREELREYIVNLLQNANWRELYPMTAVPKLNQWQVYKYVKESLDKRNQL
jgi:predicted RNA methylase